MNTNTSEMAQCFAEVQERRDAQASEWFAQLIASGWSYEDLKLMDYDELAEAIGVEFGDEPEPTYQDEPGYDYRQPVWA